MREPPTHVSEDDVLAAVRAHWDPTIDAVEHLAVGFGAHHWAASTAGETRLFVTLDALLPRHTRASLEGAYAGAVALAAQGLEFVIGCLPVACSGRFSEPFADGGLSVTPWVEGTVAGDGPLTTRSAAEENARLLGRLHAASPPHGVTTWAPLVPANFAESLAVDTCSPWDSGPYAEQVRVALLDRLADIECWTASYHRLADEALSHRWVATHGEPHTRNQMTTPGGIVFVDWESLKLAPRDRDLRTLVDSGFADLARPDWPMIEMFDLEWRLDEIAAYARWFAEPHTGTDSDRVALGGLLEELERADWAG